MTPGQHYESPSPIRLVSTRKRRLGTSDDGGQLTAAARSASSPHWIKNSRSDESQSDPFPEDVVENLFELLGLEKPWQRRWLAEKLRELPDDIAMFRRARLRDSPSMIRNSLMRLESKLTKSQNRWDIDWPAVFRELLPEAKLLVRYQCIAIVDPNERQQAVRDGRADLVLRRALDDPKLFLSLVTNARINIERDVNPGHGGARRGPDWPLQQALLLLGVLYMELTGRKPGISMNRPYRAPRGRTGDQVEHLEPDSDMTQAKQQPTGRFVKFARLCLREVGWDLSYHSTRNHWREAKKEQGW